jgi:thiamine pyrophosphate-dependent acetolactate synthase large subunit-like protein
MTAGEVFVERLIDWGVEVIFGLPGDGINGIMEALRTQPGLRSVSSRCATKNRLRSWHVVTQNSPAS